MALGNMRDMGVHFARGKVRAVAREQRLCIFAPKGPRPKSANDVELPMLLPGIKVNTSPTDHYAVQRLQLMRWDGKRWVRFGPLLNEE